MNGLCFMILWNEFAMLALRMMEVEGRAKSTHCRIADRSWWLHPAPSSAHQWHAVTFSCPSPAMIPTTRYIIFLDWIDLCSFKPPGIQMIITKEEESLLDADEEFYVSNVWLFTTIWTYCLVFVRVNNRILHHLRTLPLRTTNPNQRKYLLRIPILEDMHLRQVESDDRISLSDST